MDIDFNYIEESKHVGDQEYFKLKCYNNQKIVYIFETKEI